MEIPYAVRSVFRRMWKYAASSALAVLLDFSLLFFFVESLKWNYLGAATLSFVLGHSVNYVISRHWNFHQTDREHKIAYLLFLGFGIVSLSLTVLLLKILVSDFEFHYLNARIIAGLVVGLANFLFNYYITFKAHLIPDDFDRF